MQWVSHAHFGGSIRIGALGDPPAGTPGPRAIIRNARLIDCSLGDYVTIENIGVHIARYDIAAGAVIQNVGTLETREGARFGNGVEVEVLNEGGGREVILFDELSSQFAHLLCLHRYRPRLVERLQTMARTAASRAWRSGG